MSTSALYKPGMPWPWAFSTSDQISIWYHSVVGVIGVSLNSFALASIYFSTPIGIRKFKLILLLMTLVNLLESTLGAIMMVRLIPSYPSAVYIYIGPCNLLEARACHGFMAVQMHFAILQCSLLLFAFINRFNIARSRELMRDNFRSEYFVAGYIPAFAVMILFANNYSDPEHLRPKILRAIPQYNFSYYRIIGQINNFDILGLLNYILVFFYPLIVIVAAVIIRIMTQNRLKHVHVNRSSHKKFLILFTYQLVHPLAVVIGNVFYSIAMIFDVHVPLLEYMTIGMWSSVAAISPIIFFTHLDSFGRFYKRIWNSLTGRQITLIERVSNFRSNNQQSTTF